MTARRKEPMTTNPKSNDNSKTHKNKNKKKYKQKKLTKSTTEI